MRWPQELAFPGRNFSNHLDGILKSNSAAPIRLNPTVPPKLEDIINKLLEKDRELRYQAAAELRSDLKRLKRDTESGRLQVQDSAAFSFRVQTCPSQEPGAAQVVRLVAAARQHKAGVGVMVAVVLLLMPRLHSAYKLVLLRRSQPFQTSDHQDQRHSQCADRGLSPGRKLPGYVLNSEA